MSALRNRLLLLAMTIGLALGALPAAPPAQAAPLSAQAVAERSVTVDLSRDSIKVGGTVDATGTVTNAPAGTAVQVQRGFGGTWTTVGVTQTISAAGAFAVRNLIAPQTGAFLYRALVAGSGSAGPVSSEYAWLVVAAKHPPTIITGFVQSGGPLAGSTVRIFVPRRDKPVVTTRTTQYGYFLARLPKLPGSVRVEATGGTGPAGKFHGTMIGITLNPNVRDSSYVNPASTLLATYLDAHPKSTRAAADTKVRDLLGLKAYHNLDAALGGRPSYFDGVKFLRTAQRNGGFDAYIASLVEQMDAKAAKVTFQGTTSPAVLTTPPPPSSAVAGLIGEGAAGALGIAAQGASVVNASLGLMNLVGSLVGWTPGGGPSPSQMLSAIDQVQNQVGVMIGLLNGLTSQVKDALTVADQSAFDDATKDLGTAYDSISNTQLAYQQYVNDQFVIAACALPPLPGTTTPLAPTETCHTTDSHGNPDTIEPPTVSDTIAAIGGHFKTYLGYVTGVGGLQGSLGTGGISNDVYRDALLAGSGETPGLTFLVDLILLQNGQVFLPGSSAQLQTYVDTVITSQAWAYSMVMAYLASTDSQTFITAISNAYLGDGAAASWPQYPSPSGPTTMPTMPTAAPPGDNNLNDELTFLQGILPVPTGAAVDTKPGGLMYVSTANVELASTYLPTAASARSDCGGIAIVPEVGAACIALMTPLLTLDSDMTEFADDQGSLWADAAESGPAGTYSSALDTGWSLMSQGDLGAMLPRLAGLPNGIIAEYYFNPGPVSYGGGNDVYYVQNTGTAPWPNMCADPNGGQSSDCTGLTDGNSNSIEVAPVTDWLELFFKYMDGTGRTCTWAVAQANTNSDPCFDMPALIGRPLVPGEVYVPVQSSS